MINVFIIGSKGIPARYGGFETFVDKLTEERKDSDIKYHVSCISDKYNNEFEYNDARCFNVKTINIKSAKAVLYDIKSLKRCIKYIKKNNIENPIIYILACRIGPVMWWYKYKMEGMDIPLLLNPDGHEWKRSKWNSSVKKYWKLSEKLMVKEADMVICDSINIESYIKKEYRRYNPETIYIAYGANLNNHDTFKIDELKEWYMDHEIIKNEYFLIVGRFVPENNYYTMIKEFMKSNTKKDLVIITNTDNKKFYYELLNRTGFSKDSRVKFVGTVYDKNLLREIRKNAFAYIHGHEVGGTNPSLIEALATTKLNILLDVGFNKEVAKEGAIYFNKDENNLCNIINEVVDYDNEKISSYERKAKERVFNEFTWDIIVKKYESLFSIIGESKSVEEGGKILL